MEVGESKVNEIEYPLVSIVITSYNHGHFLKDAIGSVLTQTYKHFEVILVDDGSTDNTALIVSNYPQIKYIWQENKGLSSARNKGVANSKGAFLIFLDADDMLYPDAININLKYFGKYPQYAFISGGHDRMDENKNLLKMYDTCPPVKDYYLTLLKYNYIRMHATVMYQRWVFNHFLFDESLSACEDHDMYLKITKKFQVFSHLERVAVYRIHRHNMSHNIQLMVRQSFKMLKNNRDDSYDVIARSCYDKGRRYYKRYYANISLQRLSGREREKLYNLSFFEWKLIIISAPWQTFKLLLHKCLDQKDKMFYHQEKIKSSRGETKILVTPKRKTLRMRNLRRTNPLSYSFGYDRGGPVDRYYIENFLMENEGDIKGNVLEIGDNSYTLTYGGNRVIKSDVLFVDDSNPQATIVGDLSNADHIPSGKFDCIILTQTLHLIFDFESAIRHCYRLLKNHGSLLLTVPGISPIDYGKWNDTWYWAFTSKSIQKLIAEYFFPMDIKVETHGNLMTTTAFLYGMSHHELKEHELQYQDPAYQVIIAVRAVKNEKI